MNLLKSLVQYTYRPWVLRYLKKDRKYTYDGIVIDVFSGVFHPGFFFSTKLLIDTLRNYDLKGKSLLELGCGSALISVWTARRGARVVASDINPLAVENARKNLENSGFGHSEVFLSDLFDQVPERGFDFIVINPPYYAKDPQAVEEHAWYCGAGFEYFVRLFGQLKKYIAPESVVLMSLSQDADIGHIQQLAWANGLSTECLIAKKTGWEMHYIFGIGRATK